MSLTPEQRDQYIETILDNSTSAVNKVNQILLLMVGSAGEQADIAAAIALHTQDDKATDAALGHVQTDGDTIEADSNGVIAVVQTPKLKTARKLKVNLASTVDATFDGSADQEGIGVTGTLPVANGGTGATAVADIMAGKDALGNDIVLTYATKDDLDAKERAAVQVVESLSSIGVEGIIYFVPVTGAQNNYHLYVWEEGAYIDMGTTQVDLSNYSTKANTVKSIAISGTTVTVTKGDNTTETLATQDTTYANASTTTAGLMSASDKTKLDGITSSADKVSFTQTQTAGSQVGTITINDVPTVLYSTTNIESMTSGVLPIARGGTGRSDGYSQGVVAKTTNVSIYVSKTGDDANDGLTSSTPVLTVDRALAVAAGISTTGSLTFCFGAGEWGAFSIRNYGIISVTISDFEKSNSNSPTGNEPSFDAIASHNTQLTVSHIRTNTLNAYQSRVNTSNYVEFGYINASQSWFSVGGYVKILSRTSGSSVFYCGEGSFVKIDPSSITFSDSINQSVFISASSTCQNDIYIKPNMVVNGTFSGKKFAFSGTTTNIEGALPSTLPGAIDGTGSYKYNGIPQQGVVLTSGDQEIGGSKTFTSDLVFTTSSQWGKNLYFVTDTFEKGTITSGNYFVFEILGYDKNRTGSQGNRVGTIVTGENPTGTFMNISALKPVSGSTDSAGMGIVYPKTGTSYAGFSNCDVIPVTNNNYSLGRSSNLWSVVYAGTGSINTSDERIKSQITDIPDEVLDAWGEVQWSQYKFNDALKEKGDSARLHTGTVAQRIMNIYQMRNLNAADYGLFCHDSWEAEDWDETIVDREAVTETVKVVDQEAQYDAEGNEISPEVSHEEERVIEPEVSHVEHHHRDAGDLYSLRYEECFAMEAAYQRREVTRLKARLTAIEEQLAQR